MIPLALLPRLCPFCRNHTIIGHGRRLRQANDDRRQAVWIRRGICHPCRKTFTILPEWLIPFAQFTLRCRQLACERISAGQVAEQSAPHCRDPSRLPDPSTVRRWCWLRLLSVWCWASSNGRHLLRGPTILAWDLAALCRILPNRGQKSVTRDALDELKRHIPVLDYLRAHDGRPVRQLGRGRWMGLCPLHPDHHPSFVVDPSKGLFYCYGCGRGGDVIRFAEIYHEVRFPLAVALLRQWCGLAPLLQDAVNFYRLQLHRHGTAVAYLDQRGIRSPEVIDHMRIGYAPGACLRRWLMELGHPLAALSQECALLTNADFFWRRLG